MDADNEWFIPRCWAVLLMWVLTGCATPIGKPQYIGTHDLPLISNAPSRILLAASDGPPVPNVPTGQTVQGYHVPGRNPDSQAPWEFFLGNAAHRLIAYMYGVNYPQSRAFFNVRTVGAILQEGRIGDPSRLPPQDLSLRPDIADITRRVLYEIKPWTAQGLQTGLQEVQVYLAALNQALLVGRGFTAGTAFQGQILIRFAQGQHIWRLEWETTAPGVIQYRWTRSLQRFGSERAAYEAGQWVELSLEELQHYGGWVGQAVEGLVTRREQLATVRGAVGIVIDVAGETAKGFFTGAILGRMSSGSGAQQPPAQGGGQIIPFPARPSAPPPAQVPKASGM